MNKLIFIIVIILFSVKGICWAEKQNIHILVDFNNGEGTVLNGWTWSDDVAFGQPGWVLDSGTTYNWGKGPRSFLKSDYGNDSLAEIDNTAKAPSTTLGASLKVYDTGSSQTHQACWWVWQDGQPLGHNTGYPLAGYGYTDGNTNRMSFYLKTQGTATVNESGSNGVISSDSFHIGTYLCWNNGSPVYGSGDGCPYEGVGDQHWYFYLTQFNPGAWIHVLLDRHPSHRRGGCNGSDNSGCVAGDDPTFAESGVHYYDKLSQFYMEIRYPQVSLTSYHVDEISTYQETQQENESSITSVWVGYWSNDNKWRLGFQDMSYQTASGPGAISGEWSTFEVRYSLSPITNENYTSASIITPILYGGVGYTGNVDYFRSLTGDTYNGVYTSFVLPDNIQNHQKIYFAIKDVSSMGHNNGTSWPWTAGDGHDFQSEYIKTIDYDLGHNAGGNIIFMGMDNNQLLFSGLGNNTITFGQ